MNSDPADKKTRGWRDLPKMSFTRGAAPSRSDQAEHKSQAYNVRSAETLGAEFDNRKLSLGPGRK